VAWRGSSSSTIRSCSLSCQEGMEGKMLIYDFLRRGGCSHAGEGLVVFLKYMTMKSSLIVSSCGCQLGLQETSKEHYLIVYEYKTCASGLR
jgi:hypothetical protein